MKLSEATEVQHVDSHTYAANFHPESVIGNVPHGGYVTSMFQRAVRLHFDTTLQQQNQPHTISLRLEFLRRTQIGPATFKVKDVKLGRQASLVHVTLIQDGREEVVGYFTNSNLDTETGVSFPSGWRMQPAAPTADFSKLDSNTDEAYGERNTSPFHDFRKVVAHVRSWYPRQGQHHLALVDQILSLREPGERWTNESVGMVADLFPQIIENYNLGTDVYSIAFEQKHGVEEQQRIMAKQPKMWYPTVCLSIDFKKALPREGVKFLYSRLEAKVIKNGRYDLEIIIRDEEGDVVALSHHMVLAVSAERNTAARRKADQRDTKL